MEIPDLDDETCMTEPALRISDDDRRLLVAHYGFYRALDTGARAPATEDQRRFVAVCRGTALPVTAHESAYENLKDFLRLSGVAEIDMVASGFRLMASLRTVAPLSAKPCWTDELLSKLTPRKRAILKLRLGCLPLNEVELNKVLADKRAEAVNVRPRTLREVAALIGVSRERIRQIEARSLQKLGLTPRK
jgi:hypothetical protein